MCSMGSMMCHDEHGMKGANVIPLYQCTGRYNVQVWGKIELKQKSNNLPVA